MMTSFLVPLVYSVQRRNHQVLKSIFLLHGVIYTIAIIHKYLRVKISRSLSILLEKACLNAEFDVRTTCLSGIADKSSS